MAYINFLPDGVHRPIQPLKPDPNLGCESGSVLHRALAAGVALDHSCGGIAACATCHCYVVEGGASIDPPKADELAMLERAVDRRPNSRLGCQAVPDGSLDVVVQIPADQ